jgi:hypothetical protein
MVMRTFEALLLGFIALSQVVARDTDSRWIVLGNFYAAIKQDTVI